MIKPNWLSPTSVFAYTSTRIGGLSVGDYRGCNVGLHVGDDPYVVSRNRESLPHASQIKWLEQVHGSHVITLPSEEFIGDAAFTSTKGLCCAVMTADCVPILMCDQKGMEVAAIHAGWKGLHGNIIPKTVAHFSCQPQQLMAWIGPAICQQCYEVNMDIADAFSAYPNTIVAGNSGGKFYIDLPAIAIEQLAALGVSNIEPSRLCTYCDDRLFYSHRRATHQGKSATGRMVSVIGLR